MMVTVGQTLYIDKGPRWMSVNAEAPRSFSWNVYISIAIGIRALRSIQECRPPQKYVICPSKIFDRDERWRQQG